MDPPIPHCPHLLPYYGKGNNDGGDSHAGSGHWLERKERGGGGSNRAPTRPSPHPDFFKMDYFHN